MLRWMTAFIPMSTVAVNSGAFFDLMPSIDPAYSDVTIMRTRGFFRGKGVAIGQHMEIEAFGLCIAGFDGVAAFGDLADPRSTTERGDWYHHSYWSPNGTGGATGSQNDYMEVIDSKAKRKLRGSRERAFFVLRTGPQISVDIVCAIRTLILVK